jgi:hypothetical protein
MTHNAQHDDADTTGAPDETPRQQSDVCLLHCSFAVAASCVGADLSITSDHQGEEA